ncbi:hypothetical protein SAMN04488118_11371 [Epibacterium ulvae]|uniref:Uncharacterized protein n=1 Tax=Epibacterium ulvae TaxID=1156985 RepID=A0A1G5RD13_9RHOB|nr:hypothetical protein [Epibacterium ulvae]SCZ71994.1 hypothetical protein SAMN04488118_11371 [Epibacterium ulvae]
MDKGYNNTTDSTLLQQEKAKTAQRVFGNRHIKGDHENPSTQVYLVVEALEK